MPAGDPQGSDDTPRICPHCGEHLSPKGAFCRTCGAPVLVDGTPTGRLEPSSPPPPTSRPAPPPASPPSRTAQPPPPVGPAPLIGASRSRAPFIIGALVLLIGAGVAIAIVASGGSNATDVTTTVEQGGSLGPEASHEEKQGGNLGGRDSGPASEASSSQKVGLGKNVTGAILKPLGSGDAEGRVVFGKEGKGAAIIVEATGLQPTTEGTNSYTVWLAASRHKMLPLASTAVKGSGRSANEITARFAVPVEVLAYMADGTFDQIAITRTDDDRLEAALEAATNKASTPAYTGTDVLRGEIVGPLVQEK